MTWRAFRTAVCGLAIGLSGCFGGQTGEDSGVGCGEIAVRSDERVAGTTPAEYARTFVGTYTSPMRWSVGGAAAGIAPTTPEVPDDAITIVVTYTGGGGTQLCGTLETIDVVVDVTNRNGGVREHGAAVLRLNIGGTTSLEFEGQQIRLSTFVVGAPTMSLSGHIDALVPGLPGNSAVFPPPVAPAQGSGGTQGAP